MVVNIQFVMEFGMFRNVKGLVVRTQCIVFFIYFNEKYRKKTPRVRSRPTLLQLVPTDDGILNLLFYILHFTALPFPIISFLSFKIS